MRSLITRCLDKNAGRHDTTEGGNVLGLYAEDGRSIAGFLDNASAKATRREITEDRCTSKSKPYL